MPFATSTTLEFELAGADRIELAIDSASGRRIRLFADGTQVSGVHRVA